MKNSPGIRIPMSVGRVKEDNDKKGEICKVIDVILNPIVADNLIQDANLQLFFVELIKSYIMEKHKIDLCGSRFFKRNLKSNNINIQNFQCQK